MGGSGGRSDPIAGVGIDHRLSAGDDRMRDLGMKRIGHGGQGLAPRQLSFALDL